MIENIAALKSQVNCGSAELLQGLVISVSIFDNLLPANMKKSPAHLAWLTQLFFVADLRLYHLPFSF